MSRKGWERAGEITVDAGLCWIGDPCYVLHRDGNQPESIGKRWHDFCEAVEGRDVTQFNHDAGHAGLGVCTSTGDGDGVYDVWVRRAKNGIVLAAMVSFDGEEP